jgi:hypothetical protein
VRFEAVSSAYEVETMGGTFGSVELPDFSRNHPSLHNCRPGRGAGGGLDERGRVRLACGRAWREGAVLPEDPLRAEGQDRLSPRAWKMEQ